MYIHPVQFNQIEETTRTYVISTIKMLCQNDH